MADGETRAVGPELIARLFDAHKSALVLYARQLCADPVDAVQQAFLKLAEQRHAPEEPVAWLYRVVRNEALNASRTARRRQRRETQAARNQDGWFQSSDADLIDGATIAEAVAELPAQQREIVTAHIWGGLTFEQIGELMETSRSSAHRSYQEALRRLGERLEIPCQDQT